MADIPCRVMGVLEPLPACLGPEDRSMLTMFILIYLTFKQNGTLFYICHVQATTKILI